MKQILSFVFAAGFAVTAFSQTLLTDNFNSYVTGNLGTQGGWQRFDGAAAQVKIAEVTVNPYGKSLQFPRTNTTSMWVYKDLTTAWTNRTAGNDVLELKFDFYTGTGTGVSSMQLYNFTDDLNNIGFLEYDHSTKEFYFYDDSTVILDLFSGATNNTWYNFIVRYDYNTGEIKIINGSNTYIYTGTPFKDLVEFDIFTGVASLTSAVDNIEISAKNAATLAVSNTSKSTLSIFPNPTTDVVNISSDKKIESVSIYDATGRIATEASATSSINVENLAKGTYVVSIKFTDGSIEAKKIIKK